MNRFDNPFHDLWITEILEPDAFVKMFSPDVAWHAENLFSTGNVVIRGRQGSGKSMLLNLLNTRTRVQYARAEESYPAPPNYCQFIAGGINFTRDNVHIVVSRLSELPESKRKEWAATTFADYINYVLCADLLQNVIYLADEQKKDGVLRDEMPIDLSAETEARFVDLLKCSAAWYGYLKDCQTFESIVAKISGRLNAYKRYFNFNSDSLDKKIESTRTDIGEPIAVLAEALRKSAVIPKGALVFLKIDQHEELYELEKSSGYGDLFRRVVNSAVAMRDGRIAYRIGTRHYAWSHQLASWGSGAKLEIMRDDSLIDIDEMFRQSEARSSGFSFGKFAEDVFRRRLLVYGFELEGSQYCRPLREIFGKSLSPEERARRYAKGRPPQLRIPDGWDPGWKKLLEEMWLSDPLSARLGESWLRQERQQRRRVHLMPPSDIGTPWLAREYWKKERKEAVLVQIAGDSNEMLVWSGSRHIVDLSGWNILAFMTICRAIWAAWLRRTPPQELQATRLPRIGEQEQVVGIYEARRTWAEKLSEGPTSKRLSFIRALGAWFSMRIRSDRALSNPGHNGISLLQSDLDKDLEIISLIKICRDQGDLMESDHTTKERDARPRKKWYLNPLLCPYFHIPHIRTKEPIYTTIEALEDVVEKSRPNLRVPRGLGEADNDPLQRSLF